MKTPFSLALTASLACALFFTSCTKNETNPSETANANDVSNATSGDRITAIMKDLSTDSYSLSFSKTYPKQGITKRAYGIDNYLDFVDPQDVICGDRISSRYKKIPIWKIPTIVWPTCPDMVIDVTKLSQVQKLLTTVDQKLYGNLQQVRFLNAEGGVLGAGTFMKQFPAMQYDKIDEVTANLSLDKFLMLNDPKNLGSGATRSFYGYADLNEIVFRPYKKSLKDILKPTLKGCFDPETLKALQSQLQKIDPVYYKGLSVTLLPESKNVAILSF